MQKLLEQLFAEYHQDIYFYLYGLSRDADLAEELTAETFLEVVKSLHRFRAESDVKTWLFSIARHQWLGWLRKKGRRPEVVLLDELLESQEPPPEHTLYTRSAAQRIQELLSAEPERTRRIVQLRLSGYSFHEIAAEIGVSESSARVIDFRARTKIRETMKKEGFCEE